MSEAEAVDIIEQADWYEEKSDSGAATSIDAGNPTIDLCHHRHSCAVRDTRSLMGQ
jgi:hypothetical protein